MNFYISDLHIGHENVIKFDNRPFANADEMNDTIFSNWNSRVTRDDTVYILGDFIWHKESKWYDIVSGLTGNKVLVRGNHDPTYSSNVKKSVSGYNEYKGNCGRGQARSYVPLSDTVFPY